MVNDCRVTDNERDELEVQDLATIIGNVVIDYEDTGPHSQRAITVRDTCADWPMEIAGEVQARGFRRTEVPEPSADKRECGFMGCGEPRCEELCSPDRTGPSVDVSKRCGTCGWPVADVDGHLDKYEEHAGGAGKLKNT